MSGLRETWIAAARGENAGLRGRLLVAALIPLEWLYRLGLALYLGLEKVGMRRRTRLGARVVSIGNLTLGGTGKTSVVEALAGRLRETRGTGILLRGYGGRVPVEGLVVSDGRETLADWRDSGDEAALLAGSVPGVVVMAGRDRRLTGAAAIREHSVELLLLDDGMQYWQLHRDVDIALVDARCPFGNGHVMPAGMLREPAGGLRRVSAVVLTHVREVSPEDLGRAREVVQRLAPGAALHEADYCPMSIRSPSGGSKPAAALAGISVAALCAIGSPESFASTLESAGAHVVSRAFFPDHHPFSQDDIDAAAKTAVADGAELIVTTEKDMIRMSGLLLPPELRVLRAELLVSDFDALVALAAGEQV